MLLKYTDNHPDVKSAKQAIAQLEAEAAKSGGAGKSGGGGTTKGEIANTVYEQIKVRLVDAEAALAAVQRRLDDARSDQERIEKVAASAPGVLVQAQDLDRDYSILKRNYQELVARREATQIANAADTKTEKIQFRIVDPPQVPILPAAPNRPMLVSMVLLFGIGGGLAVPLALTQIDRSFATIGQLRNLGLPIPLQPPPPIAQTFSARVPRRGHGCHGLGGRKSFKAARVKCLWAIGGQSGAAAGRSGGAGDRQPHPTIRQSGL